MIEMLIFALGIIFGWNFGRLCDQPFPLRFEEFPYL